MRSRRGKLDMVGMTRAHLADPHIVRKVMEGREHEIRPCVGATYCLDRIYEGGEALCIHNAATGREATIPHVIREGRRAGEKGCRGRRRRGWAGGRPCRRRARSFGDGAGSVRAGRRPGPARCSEPAPQGTDRHRRLAAFRAGAARRRNPLRHLGGSRTMSWRFRRTWSSLRPAACRRTRRWRQATISSRRAGTSSPAR